jgi:5-methylcytosine-specific restriction endonuclease McrA
VGIGHTVNTIDTTSREHWTREYDMRGERLRELGFNSYAAYHRSEGYAERRRAARVAAGGICEHCDEPSDWLEIHHRTYERLGGEAPWDLLALCTPCHRRAHGRKVDEA